jgi:hypothetical protein
LFVVEFFLLLEIVKLQTPKPQTPHQSSSQTSFPTQDFDSVAMDEYGRQMCHGGQELEKSMEMI